ncbi:Major Facilitator Superfamily protein [uncultured archaeon]|nr:Major Facilitator Superfamily protein [uncultured archaeon]
MGELEKRKNTMRYSVIDGAFWAVMTNAGTSFLTPFAIALNPPLLVIGALNSVPPLLDGIAQKIGAYFSDFGWERKKILVLGVAAQAVMWLFLALLAYYSNALGAAATNLLLIAIATFIFFFGGVVNPAWFALMGDVVPEKARASWFGQLSRLINAVGLAALLFAGFFLDSMKTDVLTGFAALFAIAFAGRLLGSYFLQLHWDPKPHARKEPEAGKEAMDYSLLLFLIFFSVNIAGNYLSVYLLQMLKFDYVSFSAALISSTVFYVLAAPHWGRLIDRYGTKKVLVAAVALMSIPSFITVFVQSPIQAVLSYAFAGMLWAGVMISFLNYLYDVTRPEERIKATGHAYLMLGAGTFLGTIAGGVVLSCLGAASLASFQLLFILAGFLRIASALVLNAKTREVKAPPGSKGTIEIMASIITIYPFQAFAYEIERAVSKKRKINS